jgi:HSP20 family protein
MDRFLPVMPSFDLFDRLFDDMELPALLRRDEMPVPAFDVAETDKEYRITGEIAGLEPKDLDVTLTDGILTVRGEKREEKEDKDKHYHRVERHYGSFERRFRIPEGVDSEKTEATYKDGVLKLVLPKVEAKPAAKIEVKEEGTKKRNKKVKKAA